MMLTIFAFALVTAGIVCMLASTTTSERLFSTMMIVLGIATGIVNQYIGLLEKGCVP